MAMLRTGLIGLMLFSYLSTVAAELVVVANHHVDVDTLSKKQLIDIYMGRYSTLPNGQKVIPLDHDANSRYRMQFYSKLIGKSVSEVNAYWARLLFSGRATPPLEVRDHKKLIDMLCNDASVIGYIDSKYMTDKLKVILYVE